MPKDKAKQRMGAANGRWKNGGSSDYRRRVTGAKPGEIVHHLDHNPADNKLSNFKIIKPKGGVSATGIHNMSHPEKAIKGGKARGKQLKK